MKITRLALLLSLGIFTTTAHAQIFSETFGTNTDGTNITTANTTFTYARISTGATPTLAFKNPSSFGTGASAQLLATTASLTGLGVTSGTYTAFDVATLNFDLRTPTAFSAASSFFFGAGTGNMFTTNNTFATNDLMGGFQIITGGAVQSRSGGVWNTIAGATLSSATNYSFSVVMNGSASTVNYGTGGSVAAARADLYLNNVLVGDDVAIQDGASVSAFRMYVISQAAANGAYELDNVQLFDSAVMPGAGVIPEPGTLALAALGLAGLALRRRRK